MLHDIEDEVDLHGPVGAATLVDNVGGNDSFEGTFLLFFEFELTHTNTSFFIFLKICNKRKREKPLFL